MLQALEAELGRDRFRAQPVIEWMEQSPWMRPTDLAQDWEAWAELAFEAPVPTRNGMEVLVGSLDRLTCERGEYVVLDFKITRGEKSAEALIQEYQGQLELYAWAVCALEPEALGKVRARLIHVSPSGVREIEVPLRGIDLSESLERMGAIVSGASGAPHPSARCRYCDFLEHCSEGRASLV
jgi:predicted RecB family nuclease